MLKRNPVTQETAESTPSQRFAELQADAQAACTKEIGEALRKYSCRLVAVPEFRQTPTGAWEVKTQVAVVFDPMSAR